MAAYMVAFTDTRDAGWMEQYIAAVPAIFASFGGEYIANGAAPELLEGILDVPDTVTVSRFPSLAAIRAFMASDEYRPYAELRKTGSSFRILAFESDL
ncbi:DUF1330 domain-containing protein [Novosphingobium lentum]|uniref:DUF1330 domain-containing protein n=1 Tax=Novosphingobium lentum TaxID=145287 RepID=UPI00082BC8F5|nr:DUF1330 domain-containing protein [Novosphingobium lentum]